MDNYYIFTYNKGCYWNEFKNQDIVMFNNFNGQVDISLLLKLIDQYPTNIIRKNKSPIPFLSKRVIIISKYKPIDLYQDYDLDALIRRLEIKP